MHMTSIAPWFGGKRTLAPRIVRELGRHTQYFNPCCGSLAVEFAKEPSQKETVNDLHGDIINLARCVQFQDTAEMLYDRLQRVLFCDAVLEDAQAYIDASPEPQDGTMDLVRAYWYFLACWLQRNGTSGTAHNAFQLAVRWTKNGGSATVRFRHAVDSIPAWHHRLRNIVILRRDMFNLIPKFEDHAATAIYVDPPYWGASRNSHDAKGQYLHDFAHQDVPGNLFTSDHAKKNDHARLADMLRTFQHARVVVGYYDHPAIRKLYAGWTFVPCPMQKSLTAMRRRAVVDDAPELLIINGPSYTMENP